MAAFTEDFALAIGHYRSGHRAVAEAACRRILETDPKHAHALHLLGVLTHESGKHALAIEYFQSAIRANGSVPAFHSNLGEALRAAGEHSLAVAAYERALALDPHNVGALNNLGAAWREQGKFSEAVACLRRLLALAPNMASAHANLGMALRGLGELDAALSYFRQAIALNPGNTAALNNAATILTAQGDLAGAIEFYRRALQLDPNLADVHFNLGSALNDQGKTEEAIASYRQALALNPCLAEAWNNLGNVHKNQHNVTEAIACYERAIEAKPDFVAALSNLSDAWRQHGNLDQAIALAHKALRFDPENTEAHQRLGRALVEAGELGEAEATFRSATRCCGGSPKALAALATLKGGRLSDADLGALENCVANDRLADPVRAELLFALAKAHDQRGQFSRAAQCLQEANGVRLSLARPLYEPQIHEAFVDELVRVMDRDFFSRCGRGGTEATQPVFVFGLPRSGTTLIEQILASHRRVHGAGELQLARDSFHSLLSTTASAEAPLEGIAQLDRPALRLLAERHLAQLRSLAPWSALRIVDKMPENYLFLGLLAAMFPRATFIHCRRDLRDVALSCWMTDFGDLPWASEPAHIAARIRSYRCLMQHWRAVLPATVHEVLYEQTVADVESTARRLVALCGLEWDPQCVQFHRTHRVVQTASAVGVRQPIYTSSVGRWKHYTGALADLFAALPVEEADFKPLADAMQQMPSANDTWQLSR